MFATIVLSVILPIFIIIGIGALLDRRFTLDLPTMSRLNFYVFVPALGFVKLLEANVGAGEMLRVGAFTAAQMILLFALAWAVFSLPALRNRRTVGTLGVVLNNCGNYGLPLVLLAFGDSLVGVLIVIITVQNLFTFTAGIWLFEHQGRSPWAALGNMAKIPVIYSIAAALLVRGLHWMPPETIMAPMHYLSDGLIAVALLTLGVQLSRARPAGAPGPVAAVTVGRLLAAPLLTAAMLPFFHFTAPVAAVLLVIAGAPVAVNLSILTAEYRRDQDLAAQSIFLSTLLSAATLAVILMLVK
jgi:predicted permease